MSLAIIYARAKGNWIAFETPSLNLNTVLNSRCLNWPPSKLERAIAADACLPDSPSNAKLSGNTLRVYTFIFKVQRSSIKDVQRNLGLNSPALAQYHLEKLVSLGLARRDEMTGDYVLAKEIKVETFQQFLKIGSYIIPRFLLYTVALSVIFGYFTIFIADLSINGYSLWTYLIGGFALVVMWYETIKAWKNSP